VQASEIGHILKDHPKVFLDNCNAEYQILIAFVLFEKLKGEDSFWFPYFEIAVQADLPYMDM
jgi:hypothetical protein